MRIVMLPSVFPVKTGTQNSLMIESKHWPPASTRETECLPQVRHSSALNQPKDTGETEGGMDPAVCVAALLAPGRRRVDPAVSKTRTGETEGDRGETAVSSIRGRIGLLCALFFGACSSYWMGDGANLPALIGETQSSIEGGGKGREYIGTDTRAERSDVESKLMRAQSVKGTKAGDFHWAAFQMLTRVEGLPSWAVRFDIEAIVVTSDGLASWEPSSDSKKDKKKDAPGAEGVYPMLELTRPAPGEPWRIEDIAIDIEGARFAVYSKKEPFGDDAALSAQEANLDIFDVSMLSAAPPFDSAELIGGFGGALATGDARAIALVAYWGKAPAEEVAAKLSKGAPQDLQTILSDAPKFTGLPANTVELKVNLRGDKGERLSYTIKKTKEGYRVTSLKACAKKGSPEFDMKELLKK